MSKFGLTVVLVFSVCGCAEMRSRDEDVSAKAAKPSGQTDTANKGAMKDPVEPYDPEPSSPTARPDAGTVAEPPTVEPYDPEPAPAAPEQPETKAEPQPETKVNPVVSEPAPAAPSAPVVSEPVQPASPVVDAPVQPEAPIEPAPEQPTDPVVPIVPEPAPSEPAPVVTPPAPPAPIACMPDRCEGKPLDACVGGVKLGAASGQGASDSGSWSIDDATLDSASDIDGYVLSFKDRTRRAISVHVSSDLPSAWSGAYYTCEGGTGAEACGVGTTFRVNKCLVVASDFVVACSTYYTSPVSGAWYGGRLTLAVEQPATDGIKTAAVCGYHLSVSWN